jgi:hypothetical protein
MFHIGLINSTATETSCLGDFAEFVYGAELFGKMNAGKIELSNLYTAIAGLFAIITGFLATFYGSIQAIIDTRLKRIATTAVFRRFISYIKTATLAGFVIALVSIPLIILTPSAD